LPRRPDDNIGGDGEKLPEDERQGERHKGLDLAQERARGDGGQSLGGHRRRLPFKPDPHPYPDP
jgi:hypothetical protein